MIIFIKTFTGKTIVIEVENTNTIYQLKEKIKGKEGHPINNQRLIFGGKLMDDRLTVETYQLHKEGSPYLKIIG